MIRASDPIILLTGGSSGIGKALYRLLWRDSINNRRTTRIIEFSRRGAYPIDLLNPTSVSKGILYLGTRPLHTVVLNAAVLGPQSLGEAYQEDPLETNLKGHISLLQELLLRNLLGTTTQIIYILTRDILKYTAPPYYPIYQASKAGLEQFSRAFLPQQSYRVYFGVTSTPMLNPNLPIPSDLITPHQAAEFLVTTFFKGAPQCQDYIFP